MGHKGISLAEMQIVPSCTSIRKSNALFRIKKKKMNFNNRYDIALNGASLLIGSLTMFHNYTTTGSDWHLLPSLISIALFVQKCQDGFHKTYEPYFSSIFKVFQKGRHAKAQQQHQLWQEVLAKAEMMNPGSLLLPCSSTLGNTQRTPEHLASCQ